MHFLEFQFRPVGRRAVGPRTYRWWGFIKTCVHEVSLFVGLELVMRPEGIIESKIPVLATLGVIGIV